MVANHLCADEASEVLQESSQAMQALGIQYSHRVAHFCKPCRQESSDIGRACDGRCDSDGGAGGPQTSRKRGLAYL